MKTFAIKFLFYGIAVLYLVMDLFVFDGPLKKKIEASRFDSDESVAAAKAQGIVARVYQHPILLSQVDRRVQDMLFREGRDPDSVNPQEMKWRRLAAMNELVDEALLKVKVVHNTELVPVTEEEIEASLARFTQRFSSSEVLEQALVAQGYQGMKELRYRVAARLQQEKYLDLKISDAVRVSDAEARKFYEKNRNEFQIPRQVKVRHIFFEQLERGGVEAKRLADNTLQRLDNENFSRVCQELSDDPQSRSKGGELGWISSGRIDELFTAAIMKMEVDERGVVKSKIGYHIVDVTAVKEETVADFENVRADIIAAMRSERSIQAIKAYKEQLRWDAGRHCEIFADMFK